MKLAPLALLSLAACHGGKTPEVPAVTLPQGSALVAARISNVKTSKGSLGCSLFNSGPGFPGKSPITGGALMLPAREGHMLCEFKGLPPGDYAVAVFHDENGNGTLDENVFGAPAEGYGASNNKLHATSSPTWDESKFTVTEGQQRELTIDLRY